MNYKPFENVLKGLPGHVYYDGCAKFTCKKTSRRRYNWVKGDARLAKSWFYFLALKGAHQKKLQSVVVVCSHNLSFYFGCIRSSKSHSLCLSVCPFSDNSSLFIFLSHVSLRTSLSYLRLCQPCKFKLFIYFIQSK